MEKKVFCSLQGRSKCIKFQSEQSVSDLEIIREKIREICERDTFLKKLSENKLIIVQKKDIDADVWIDVEDDEIVCDLDKLNILLLPTFESVPNVLHASNENLSYEVICTAGPLNVLEKSTENDPEDLSIEDISKSEMSVDDDSNVDKNIIDQSKKTRGIQTGPGSIKMPAILPPLSYGLKKKIEDYGVLASQKDLIYHWGSFLWQTTDAKPMKIDYQNLASTIVSAYPLLKGGPKGYDIVRAQLITWIRNHRTILRNQGEKRNAEGNIINDAPKTSKVAISSETSEPSKLDVSRALLELEKKQGKEGNTLHVQSLIRLTLNERLIWIKNEAKSILEVVTKYPHLKDCDSMLFEFYNLKNTTADLILQSINSMFSRLKNYFQVKVQDKNFEIKILTQLNDSLSKKLKKEVKPLFTFKQARSTTDCLMAEENESPRAVIYSDSVEVISAAFIVADTNIRVQISNPTVPKVLACLLAAYYVWDTIFPKQYLNVLEYIDSEVLGTHIKKNQVLLKFIRKRDHGTTSNESQEAE